MKRQPLDDPITTLRRSAVDRTVTRSPTGVQGPRPQLTA